MHIQRIVASHWKFIVVLVVIVAVLGVLTYAFVSPRGAFSDLKNDLKSIEPAEESEYTDLSGNTVDLAIFKGKPLIINSWASWIPFSQTELVLLEQIQVQHEGKLQVLAVNRMEQVPMVRSFLSTFGISDALTFLIDPTDNFYTAIGGYAMPETVFYDAEGVLLYHKRGVLTESEINEYVAAMLTTE